MMGENGDRIRNGWGMGRKREAKAHKIRSIEGQTRLTSQVKQGRAKLKLNKTGKVS